MDFSLQRQAHNHRSFSCSKLERTWIYIVRLVILRLLSYMSITYSWFPKPRMSCHTAWRCCWTHFTSLHLTSFALPPPCVLKFMAGRKPTAGKQVRSWLALEALAVLEEAGVEGVGMGSLWELTPSPMTFEQLEPSDAWCCWFCSWSWSCLVLRNRPPDPRARFMAWRCRDSWRYGWEQRNFCKVYLPGKLYRCK